MVWSYQVDVEFSLVDADGVHLFDSHPSLLQKRGVDESSWGISWGFNHHLFIIQKAIEHGPFIVDLPINNCDFQ